MAASNPETTPVELHLDRSRHLRIAWADGHESVIPLARLRKACPCAECRAARQERARNPLAVVQPAGDPRDAVTAADAEMMGRYALRMVWKDGHATGIYDFGLLRELGEGEQTDPG